MHTSNISAFIGLLSYMLYQHNISFLIVVNAANEGENNTPTDGTSSHGPASCDQATSLRRQSPSTSCTQPVTAGMLDDIELHEGPEDKNSKSNEPKGFLRTLSNYITKCFRKKRLKADHEQDQYEYAPVSPANETFEGDYEYSWSEGEGCYKDLKECCDEQYAGSEITKCNNRNQIKKEALLKRPQNIEKGVKQDITAEVHVADTAYGVTEYLNRIDSSTESSSTKDETRSCISEEDTERTKSDKEREFYIAELRSCGFAPIKYY